jgi:hypothetical protein
MAASSSSLYLYSWPAAALRDTDTKTGGGDNPPYINTKGGDKMTNNPIPQIPGLDMNSLTKMLGGMNLPALSNMLSGVNIAQLLPLATQIMGGMKNLAPAPQNPGFGGQNPGIIPQGYGQFPVQQAAPSLFPPIPQPYVNDPRVLVLNTMKPFLPADKCRIIDSILGVMAVIFTINSVLPRRPVVAPVQSPPLPPPPPPPPTTTGQPIQDSSN